MTEKTDNTKKNCVSEKMLEDTFKELCSIIADTNDTTIIYDFLCCLFTQAERKDISNRWLLVKEIDKGTTQREIAKKFGMSLCKITRGSRELNKKDSAFRKILDKKKSKK